MLLSPRKLFFLYQFVMWECSDQVWHESTGTTGIFPTVAADSTRTEFPATPKRNIPGTVSQPVVDKVGYPVGYYLDLVRQYVSFTKSPGPPTPRISYGEANLPKNTRALSFPEDGLNAFLGITTKLTDYFPDGFLWALPIALFDIALLWQPAEDITRRDPKRDGALQLPSWSWVGWQGLIDCEDLSEKYEQGRKLSATHIPSLSSAPGRTPISKFYYTDNGTRRRLKAVHTLPGRDHRPTLIRQPSPILSVYGPVAKCEIREIGRDTRNGRGGVYDKYFFNPRLPDTSSTPYGIIPMSPGLYFKTGNNVECELLAISSASCRFQPSVVQLEGSQRNLWKYHNVLWIERKDSIVYRRGLRKIK